MKWTSIRDQFPNCWVLVEALSTHSISNKRTIDEMSVISDYINPKEAWATYKKLHFSDPSRELYIFWLKGATPGPTDLASTGLSSDSSSPKCPCRAEDRMDCLL